PRLSSGSFYGGTLRSYRTGEILLAESAYSPGCRIPTHTHDRAFGYLVLAGSCTETCSDRTRVHLPSHLVLHPEGEAHSDHWADVPGRCLHIEFGASWLERVRQHSPVLGRTEAFRGGSPVWLAARLYKELRA